MSLLSTIQRLYPQARITSGYRSPNNPLSIANPRSMHMQGSPSDPHAVDVAPIPGVSYADYINALKGAGVPIAQSFDEASHPFPWTTGPNWHVAIGATPQKHSTIDTSKPYYTGADNMGIMSSLYPVVNGVDPLAPEPPTTPTAIPGSPAPSQSVQATAPIAAHKHGGILGALQSVFMPDPGSLWAGALRDGVFNAKESQQNYKLNQYKQTLDLATANQKLMDLQRHGQYQVVGNNVFHVKPDGTTEMISGPSTLDDKIKLIDEWHRRQAVNPHDPTLPILEGVILGGYNNTPEGQAAANASRETAARLRAGATVKAATIRGANSPSNANLLPPLPPGAKVIH